MPYGAGLACALFFTEFCKAFFISLMWAVNVRTAVRLKGAFCAMAFEKIISLRVQSGISNGEVTKREQTNHLPEQHRASSRFSFDGPSPSVASR